jgi:GNAT superfamily N-acetyltransferase
MVNQNRKGDPMNFSVPNSFELAKLQCNDNTSRALSWLLRDPQPHLPMTECIYRVQAEILAATPGGVVLRNLIGNIGMVAGEEDQLPSLLGKLPEDITTVLLCGSTPTQEVLEEFSQYEFLDLWQWGSFTPPAGSADFEIWPLDAGDLSDAISCGIPPEREEELSAAIQRQAVYGACIDDQLAGTVGINALGGIDFLAVRPDLRGQGIGRGLFRHQVRQELRAGHLAYFLSFSKESKPRFLERKRGKELP